MTAGTTEIQKESSTRSAAWFAASIGAGIGIAALAFRRKRRNPWDRARDQANHLIGTAREEMKPWMGAVAGTAAAGTAVAVYMRNRKESGWQRAGKRASRIASRVGTQAGPWTNLAATTAIGLASIAYANKARKRTIRGIDDRTAARINAVAEQGVRVLRGIRNISEQAGRLYPRVRRAIA
jgi:hypothetical protein